MKRPPLVLALGLALLAIVWLGPLPALAPQAFFAHMLMHVGVVALAAPLIALGLCNTRLDPVRRWPAPFAPLPASLLDLVVIWAWHSPALHHLARHEPRTMLLEQGMFLAVSLLVWLSAFGGDHRRRAAGGIAALLLTSSHMSLLGALLATSPRALYEHALAHQPFGLNALEDQQLGGVLMLFGAGSAYMVGALWLLAGLLRRRRGVSA